MGMAARDARRGGGVTVLHQKRPMKSFGAVLSSRAIAGPATRMTRRLPTTKSMCPRHHPQGALRAVTRSGGVWSAGSVGEGADATS